MGSNGHFITSWVYIVHNREKHQLPASKKLQKSINSFVIDQDHAFRTDYTGGFDVVIGNPPYLRVQGLRENFETESIFYENNYQSATGRFDIYVLFIERFYSLIKSNGVASLILPHKFLVSDFGEGIRLFLVDNKAVNELLHFGSEMVFADASTYTCIISLSQNNQEIYFKKLKPIEIFNPFSFDIAKYETLSENKWNLKSEQAEKIFNKIKLQPWTVKDVFENISQGIVSVGDDIFLLRGKIVGDRFIGYSEKIGENLEIEAAIVKPLLKGEDVKRYSPLMNNYFCLYPHSEINGKTVALEEEYFKTIFPQAYNYILPFKDELIEKKIRYKTNPKAWYSLHRSREMSLFEQEKIVTPETSFGGNMTIDSEKYYHNTQVYSLVKKSSVELDLKIFIAIMNSTIFWYFLKNTGTILRGGYFRFKTKYLEPFPLPKLKDLNGQELFIEKVDVLLLNSKTLSTQVSQFLNYIQSQFPIEKFSKKLQTWHDLEFGELSKELNKAIKKAGGNKLTKSDEMEWMDLFETKKAEAQSLKSEIDKTDREIDQMVYALYGLTEDEIKIVESQ